MSQLSLWFNLPVFLRRSLVVAWVGMWSWVGNAQFGAPYPIPSHVAQTRSLLQEALREIDLDGKSERDKAKAIYDWITRELTYDTERYFSRNITPHSQSLYKVLSTRLAVCAGYANLFNAIALEAGLNSHVVNGYAKGFSFNRLVPPGNFAPNHSWNLVHWDGAWHFIDATWGSGWVSGDMVFTPNVTAYWFDTPAHNTLFTHYTEDCDLGAMYEALVPEAKWSWGLFKVLPRLDDLFRAGYPSTLALQNLSVQPKSLLLLSLPNTRQALDLGITPEAISAFIMGADESTLGDMRALVKAYSQGRGSLEFPALPMQRRLEVGQTYTWHLRGNEGDSFVLSGPEPPAMPFHRSGKDHTLEWTPTAPGACRILRSGKDHSNIWVLEYEVR